MGFRSEPTPKQAASRRILKSELINKDWCLCDDMYVLYHECKVDVLCCRLPKRAQTRDLNVLGIGSCGPRPAVRHPTSNTK